MESKKINKQFNSLFWGFIYAMPLFILLITYLGYFNMYKENQTYKIESNTTIISGEDYLSCTPVPDSGYVENIYFNTNLSVEEVVSIIESANLTYEFDGMEVVALSVDETCGVTLCVYEGIYLIFTTETGDFVFSSGFCSEFGVDFVGWKTGFNGINVFNKEILSAYNENDVYIAYGSKNTLLSSLFSITPIEHIFVEPVNNHKDSLLIENTINNNGTIETSYYSLFDISIIHTINTFDGFVFEPLHNTFIDVLPKINFSNDTLIAQLLILVFTWFVQGMFIHIIVDTLTLVPKMYHKLMERWLG